MQWTCQVESGPLWWKLQRSEHWYRRSTDPAILVNDYLLTHLHHLGEPLVLKWWKAWGVVEFEVRIESGRLLDRQVEEMGMASV